VVSVVSIVVPAFAVAVVVLLMSAPQSGHLGSGLGTAAKVMPLGRCSMISASSSSTKMQMPPRRISEDLLENSCSACSWLVFFFSIWPPHFRVLIFVFGWSWFLEQKFVFGWT